MSRGFLFPTSPSIRLPAFHFFIAGVLAFLAVWLMPLLAFASEGAAAASGGAHGQLLGIDHPLAPVALAIFVIAYVLVMFEEVTRIKKSKPVLMAAGLIWMLVAWGTMGQAPPGHHSIATVAFREVFLEFAELMLFLMVAMTFVNTMSERGVFEALKAYLIRRQFSYRKVFWITGVMAFFLSPIIDNLTTALVMGAVVVAVGSTQPKFVLMACISIVVAANAGGAFSPFGDVTTLMVWQKGVVGFTGFLALFVPSVVNWLIPAAIISIFLPGGMPETSAATVRLKPGARRVIGTFALTILITVLSHQYLHLPPVFGMMFGLGLLKVFGFYLRRVESRGSNLDAITPFNIFNQIAHIEWDTLLFFYGVILGVGGLAGFGYLDVIAHFMYEQLGPTIANAGVGVMSAIVDNIPVMYAVLAMYPQMDHGQWLLVTLTAGVGGSLLSIGSAAGVALMGTAHGKYTFVGHLKWSWAIALGYVASIFVHMWLNGGSFDGIPVPKRIGLG